MFVALKSLQKNINLKLHFKVVCYRLLYLHFLLSPMFNKCWDCFRFRLKEDHFSTKPLFGILLVLDSTPGVIRVGDPVYVVRGDVLNRK